MVGVAGTIGVPFMLLRATDLAAPQRASWINTRSTWHVVSGRYHKVHRMLLENDNATRRPPRLHIGIEDPKDLIEGQEQWGRYALTSGAVSHDAVTEAAGQHRWRCT